MYNSYKIETVYVIQNMYYFFNKYLKIFVQFYFNFTNQYSCHTNFFYSSIHFLLKFSPNLLKKFYTFSKTCEDFVRIGVGDGMTALESYDAGPPRGRSILPISGQSGPSSWNF
jgi:hypothetical protein